MTVSDGDDDEDDEDDKDSGLSVVNGFFLPVSFNIGDQ